MSADNARFLRPAHTPRIALLLALAGMAPAMAHAAAPTLRLKPAPVDVTTLPNAKRPNQAQAQRLPERMVLVLDGPITAERRARIDATGAKLGDYLPDHAYVVDLRDARLAPLRNLDFVTHLIEFQDEWKLDPTLATRPALTDERKALAAAGKVATQVYLFPGESITESLKAIELQRGVEIMRHELLDGRFMIEVTGSVASVSALAKLDQVQWIEPAPQITMRNSSDRWIVQSNVNGFYPVYDAGLHGEDQLVAVMDGRVDVDHCSFADPENDPFGDDHRKIQAYNASLGVDYHGTHVAGTVLGDNGVDNNTRGVAYMARMVFNTPPAYTYAALTSRLSTHYSQGANIHTNSWGDDSTTAYTGMARAIDTFSFSNDDNLVIFAATNLGNLRTPENAKNCLAVGASQDASNQGAFCSGGIGPTSDGRRKPELFAPGCGTTSAEAFTSCDTISFTGTSMAAPAIAGCAALTKQYFEEGFYPSGMAESQDGFTPSGTLIKATLLNSAVDMTGISGYPSNGEGWGRVLMDNALYFAGDDSTLIVRDVRNASNDALQTGDADELIVSNSSLSTPMRVTLVWHDAPGTPNASFAPVNNLDLEVVIPGGQVIRGNNISNGTSTFSETTDEINNVEMVMLPATITGDYTVRVKGTAVNQGPQGYALVITGAVTEAGAACPADLTGDGSLNFFDVSAFLNAFNAQDPVADFNDDGSFNFFDVSAYLSAFNAGCP